MTFFADFSQIPDLSVSPLASNVTFVWFLRLSQFQPFFGHFLYILQLNTKSIKFCTIFYIKQFKFPLSRCTSLLLCSTPIPRNCLRFSKYFKKQCSIQGLMRLTLLRERLLLSTFLYQKMKKKIQKRRKDPIWRMLTDSRLVA